ncbi:hypothetical protein Ga0100231_004935 [Opitutaceae bacterium TAV4]|nr:hypothetical protein Ga0100231_004935 [Opitutaceae bacterium TAV4]RRK02340.1 hypothetical protein Ga0100230_004080 [Opitutaceae bacterium TAV3]
MIAALTLTLGWWIIPALITLGGIVICILAYRDDMRSCGWGRGISTIFAVLVFAATSGIAWALYLGLRLLFR